MDINKLKHKDVHWKERARQKEIDILNDKLKRTVRLCKAIMENMPSIECIKLALSNDCELEASEAWNELDEHTQNLLITAPTFGGPFTTNERAKLTELWDKKQA